MTRGRARDRLDVVAETLPSGRRVNVFEDDEALTFVAGQPDLRYVAQWVRWYVFDGVRWYKDDTLAVFDRVRQHLREARAELDGIREERHAASASTVAAVERLARSDRRIAATVDQWDCDPWLLGTPGGVVDLRTGGLRAARREDYITRVTKVTPDGECPRWRSFLGEVTDYDVELIDYLQRLCGYALTGSTREHIFAFFYGTGANGKGSFLNTLSAVLGDYGLAAPAETFTEATTERHPTELAMLHGARLVMAQETEEGRRWATTRVKSLTGGDPVTARFMRVDYFTYVPQFKLIVAGNHKPALRHVDEAIRRRIHLVPFTVTIPEPDRDKDLPDKLVAEGPGILAWMIEGCLAYQAQGLQPPESVRAATDAYLEDQDELATWIADCCAVGPDKWENPAALFRSWCAWAKASELAPGNQKVFKDRLESAGFARGKTNLRGRYHQGIALHAVDPADE